MATFYGAPDNRTREVITASEGDDSIYPLGGWDVIQGKGGIDTVFVYGKAADFRLITEEGVTYINALSGASAGSASTQLYDVERVVFDDKTIDLAVAQRFEARDGNDNFVGNAGTDTVVYAAPIERYRIERSGDYQLITDLQGAGGVDRLRNIERLEFSNGKVALDLGGDARDAARLIGTLLGPQLVKGPQADKALLGTVIGFFDQGQSLLDVAQIAMNVLGWNKETLIAQVFLNGLGRPALPEETAALLASFQATPIAEMAALACNLGLVDTRIDLAGLASTGLVYT